MNVIIFISHAGYESGLRALLYAAEDGNCKKMKKLLEKGINPDDRVDGQTALTLAARNNDLQAIKLLLKHNATINQQGNIG